MKKDSTVTESPMNEAVVRMSEPCQDSFSMPGWKRNLDLFCIVVASPVWVPVMGLIALAIKIISPGPVLFKQDRIGYLGRPFKCLKFRTMQVDAALAAQENYLKGLI